MKLQNHQEDIGVEKQKIDIQYRMFRGCIVRTEPVSQWEIETAKDGSQYSDFWWSESLNKKEIEEAFVQLWPSIFDVPVPKIISIFPVKTGILVWDKTKNAYCDGMGKEC